MQHGAQADHRAAATDVQLAANVVEEQSQPLEELLQRLAERGFLDQPPADHREAPAGQAVGVEAEEFVAELFGHFQPEAGHGGGGQAGRRIFQ
ncbi:hypothetical protein D3C81_1342270 [compost metagenome]